MLQKLRIDTGEGPTSENSIVRLMLCNGSHYMTSTGELLYFAVPRHFQDKFGSPPERHSAALSDTVHVTWPGRTEAVAHARAERPLQFFSTKTMALAVGIALYRILPNISTLLKVRIP
jgi:hypothetical protein